MDARTKPWTANQSTKPRWLTSLLVVSALLAFFFSLSPPSQAQTADYCTGAPDIVPGGDFSYSCFLHDECYINQQAVRSVCDNEFSQNMGEECYSNYRAHRNTDIWMNCQATATLYYNVVDTYGLAAYMAENGVNIGAYL